MFIIFRLHVKKRSKRRSSWWETGEKGQRVETRGFEGGRLRLEGGEFVEGGVGRRKEGRGWILRDGARWKREGVSV